MLGIGIILVGVAAFIFALTSQRISGAIVLVAYGFAMGTTVYGLHMAFSAYEDKEYSAASAIEIENAIKICPRIKTLIADRRPNDYSIKYYELQKWVKSCNEPTLADQKKAADAK